MDSTVVWLKVDAIVCNHLQSAIYINALDLSVPFGSFGCSLISLLPMWFTLHHFDMLCGLCVNYFCMFWYILCLAMSQVCSPERLSATVSDRPTPNRQVATPRTPRRSQASQPVSPVATEIDSDGSPSPRSPRSRSRRLSQRHSPSTKSQSRRHSPIPAAKSGEDDLLLLLEVGEILRNFKNVHKKIKKDRDSV